MDSPKFPRGSEWRKWDLEVHTPFSALNNGFGDDFDEYARTVLKCAVEKGIAAIGVTDYFLVEGFKRLKALVSDNAKFEALVTPGIAAKARSILLLPNIEFRTSVIITRPNGEDSRVNFHVIFSDDVETNVIEEHFLRELKFTAESNPDSRDERWSLTLANLEDLGKRLKEQHEKFRGRSDLHVGMMNAVVAHEDVSAVLEEQPSRFKDRFLIAVAADEDLSKCSWDGQAHLARKLFIQKSHMLFSSNPGTIEFGLGKKHAQVQAFVNEFKSQKPCIHGSDSHSYESLFEPVAERNLWIKADPTFQGLKQLLNEPEDRVFMGKVPPSLERSAARPTRVVEAINIRKVQDSTLPEKWFNCSLQFNAELVAIIGNKGSGKSALADVLGLLGNTPRYRSFSFLRVDRFRDPRSNKARQFEAELSWADKTREGPILLDQDPDSEAPEKVKYIPQNYLEEICNEVGLGKGSRFYAELQQVIFSHVSESERLGFDSLDALLEHRSAEINEAIEFTIVELREVNKQIVTYEEHLTLRYRKTLELQLAEKRRELKAHEQAKPIEVVKPEGDPVAQKQSQETSSALEDKQKIFHDYEAEITKCKSQDVKLAKKRAIAEKLLSRLKNMRRQVEGALAEAASDIEELSLRAENLVTFKVDLRPIERILQQVDAERASCATQLNPKVTGSLEQERLKALTEIQQLQEALSAQQRAYQEYLQKLREWEAVRRILQGLPEATGTIANLEKQLAELGLLPQALRGLYGKREKKALEIFREKRRLRAYYEAYYSAVKDFLGNHPLAARGNFKITFDVAIIQSGFAEGFLNKINLRKTGSFAGVSEGAAEVKRLLDTTSWDSARSVLRFTRRLMAKLKSSDGRALEVAEQLKQEETAQDIYDFIYAIGYLSPIYRLAWEGKGLEQLSPGERGNLLLIFYLLVDRDDIPLVIDQPEENLDNQTVVKTLVPCMKDAKRRRQIVMVTHNPNLAVVCDAEQIIYAEIRKEYGNEVTYLSGSIEDPTINEKIVDVLEGTRPAFDKRESKYLP
jgi:ABC-type lipoprotein export system ATPase subunit